MGDHKIPVPYKVGGTIKSYMWGTLRVIDSNKVPAVDSNHIVTVGAIACPCPRGLGALIVRSGLVYSVDMTSNLAVLVLSTWLPRPIGWIELTSLKGPLKRIE